MHSRVSAHFSCPVLVFSSHCFALRKETTCLPALAFSSQCVFSCHQLGNALNERCGGWIFTSFGFLGIIACQVGHYAINECQPLVWFLFLSIYERIPFGFCVITRDQSNSRPVLLRRSSHSEALINLG